MKRKLLKITFIALLFGFQSVTDAFAFVPESSTQVILQSARGELDFTISPNPGSSKINLRILNLDSEVTLTVIDILGKKILSKSLSQVNTSIDVSEWNNGVYLIRIISDKKTQTKRFVKQ